MLLKLTTTAVVFLLWAPVASAWSWPVKGPVLQPFSYDEAHPYDAGQHRGIDIGANATGDPVVAPESGTVSFAGFVPTSGESLTIETAGGYSVTLTHLGSISVAKGASVTEGDVDAAVGPSGTPEQSVPYVHLGVRLTADPLGYLDPLGLLPAPEPATPAPAPAPQPVPQAVPVPRRVRSGGGLVVKNPVVVKHPVVARPAVDARVEPAHAAESNPRPKPQSHQARTFEHVRTDSSRIRRPLLDPLFDGVAVPATALGQPLHVEPLVLSVVPGIVAALLALITVFSRRRRPTARPAEVIAFTKELPLQRVA